MSVHLHTHVCTGVSDFLLQADNDNSINSLIPKRSNSTKPSQGKTHPCSECGQIFHSATYLWRHMKDIHNNFRKCDQCDTVCPNKRSLIAHKKKEHNYQALNYNCDICGKAFNDGFSLYWHKRKMHEDKKAVKDKTTNQQIHCNICETAFKGGAALRWHKIKSHNFPAINYKCKTCGLSFKDPVSLRWHKKKQHEVGVSYTNKQYLLLLLACGKAFYCCAHDVQVTSEG